MLISTNRFQNSIRPVWLLPLLLMAPLRAQEVNPPRGDIEIGIRALAGNRSSSQFDEYRDIRPGLYIEQANFDLEHLFHTNSFLTFQTRQSWQKDQRFLSTFGNYGKVNCTARLDGTPHDFTSTAQTFFTESAPGMFTVSPSLRATLTANPGSITSLLGAGTPVDVALKRRLAGGSCQFTPSSAWTFTVQYSRESSSGYRPIGTTLNDETNVMEMMEPVDYRTNEVKAGVEYAGRRVVFQAGYNGSFFHDQNKALYWDNPFRTADATGSGAHGQMALYPDNNAQGVSFAGAINFSAKTRLMVSISPEWMRQNSAFLPETVNTAITGVPALPAGSLKGRKTTIATNLTFSSHPLARLSLKAHYRDYDYINNTQPLFFSNYAYTDRQLDNLARESLPYGFNKQSIGASASWLLHDGESLTAAYEFVDLVRQHRDVSRSRENTGSLTFDANPKKWVSFRGSFEHSSREPEAYVWNLELYPLGSNPPLIDGFQMFDEAARVRNRGKALLEVDPSTRIAITASYDNMQDRYRDSVYGMLGYRSMQSSTDISYQFDNGMTLFSGYAYERYNTDQRSRQYSKTNSTSNNDWESYIGDAIHTVSAGASVARFRHVTFDAFYSLSMASGRIDNRILGNPALSGFLVTTAQDYPETGNRFHQLSGVVRYRLGTNLYSKFQYRWERYDRSDFQIQSMTPYMALFDSKMNTSLFLGADVPAYQVHIVSVSLDYRF